VSYIDEEQLNYQIFKWDYFSSVLNCDDKALEAKLSFLEGGSLTGSRH